MNIKFLQAYNGDAILINFHDDDMKGRNILIDGGTASTYFSTRFRRPGPLKIEIDRLREAGEVLDILILTHIDSDHIGGLLSWFAKDPSAVSMVKEVWFNSGKLVAEYFGKAQNDDLALDFLPETSTNTSIPQGIDFEQFIAENGIWNRQILVATKEIDFLGLSFIILSPNDQKLRRLLDAWKKEDPSVNTSGKAHDYGMSISDHIASDKFEEDTAYPNGSSIAFLLKWQNKQMLFLGDAHPSVVESSLRALGYSETNKIKVEFVKVSHHASAGNTSPVLLDLIATKNFFISTNGDIHNHPNKQTLARIINNCDDCNLFFNYYERTDRIFSVVDHQEYPKFNTAPIPEEFSIK